MLANAFQEHLSKKNSIYLYEPWAGGAPAQDEADEPDEESVMMHHMWECNQS